MALVNCLECGKQVSDSVTKCPFCGADRLRAVGSTEYSGFCKWIGVFLAGMIVLGYGYENGNRIMLWSGYGILALAGWKFLFGGWRGKK